MSDKVLIDREVVLGALAALEGFHEDGYIREVCAAHITNLRAALAQEALDRLAETNRELGLDYAEPLAQEAEPDMPPRENRFKGNYIINDPLPTAHIVGNKIMDAPPAAAPVAHPSPPCVSGRCPNKAACDEAQHCLYHAPAAPAVTDAMTRAAEHAHDSMRESRGLVGGFCRDAVPAMIEAALAAKER